MGNQLPHTEDSHITAVIPPKDEFIRFMDDAHYTEKVKEWGLSTAKKEYWYKNKTHQRLVSIIGYESYGLTGEYNTCVIQFQDGKLSCIHPAYLKEMQSGNFGKESLINDETVSNKPAATETVPLNGEVSSAQTAIPEPKRPSPAKEKKEKAVKLVLPEEKVHFTGTVKQFALSWNHFNEENDEVIILENVRVEQEESLEIGLAWCSHSKTLKKFELQPGESLEFDGKIVKKILPKGKDIEDEALKLEVTVSYKINNPSKIAKK